MADDSDFVLRWEIPNANEKIDIGRELESEEFHKGGFIWKAKITQTDNVGFTLQCGVEHSEPWKCEAKVTRTLFGWARPFVRETQFVFSEDSCCWAQVDCIWATTLKENYCKDDVLVLEFLVQIISSEGSCESISELAKFDAPNNMSNVIVKIGEKNLHVSKELLALHSPVFKTLFFGEFNESGKEEVEIKDVDCKEFLDLLRLIYLDNVNITDLTVPHLLKLADRFQMERVMNLAKTHLTQTKGFDVLQKLHLADQYRFDSLKEHCLKSFTDSADLISKLKTSPEFDNFSGDLKIAICERIVKM